MLLAALRLSFSCSRCAGLAQEAGLLAASVCVTAWQLFLILSGQTLPPLW